MATQFGKITYNAYDLRGGRVSDIGGTGPQASSISEPGKYVQEQGNLRGLEIDSQSFYLANSIVPSTISSVANDIGINIGQYYDATTTSNGNIFFLTSLGYVVMLSSAVYTNLGVVIATTKADGSIWTHMDSTGAERVYVAGNLNGNVYNLKRMNTDGTNLVTVRNVAQTAGPMAKHRGVVGLLNRSYITNGGYIATYDPVLNVSNDNKLYLGIGWETTSIRQYGNYMAITGYKSDSSSRLWLWDGSSEYPNFQYEINDRYATCYVEGEKLLIFTNGRNKTTKLYIFKNSDIGGKPFWETSSYAINPNGYVPEQGSVCSFKNGVHWRGPNNAMFCYQENYDVYGVHNIYSANLYEVTGADTGLCKSLYNESLFVSGSSTNTNAGSRSVLSTYGIDPNTYSTENNGTYFSFPSKVLPHGSTVKYVKFLFTEFTNLIGKTPSVTYQIRNTNNNSEYFSDNSSTLTWANVAAGFAAPLVPPNNYTYHVFHTNITNIDIFRLAINIRSCAIREIEVGYIYDTTKI
jgi:hypothetical protein